MGTIAFRRSSAVVVLCMLGASLAMAQDTATLMGQVTDKETGDALPGANVFLERMSLGQVTDESGRYILRDIPPGKVEVAISFIGYTTALYKVELRADETRTLDVGLEQEILIFDDCIVWTEDQQPFREYPDMTFDLPKRTVTSEFDDPCFPQPAWPIHSVADAAALLPGVDRLETTDSLALRGRTAGATTVYVDGIPIMGAAALPWPAVQSVEVLDGHIPVQYGNVSSGVVSITTERGKEPGLRGSLEGLSSEVMDAYGYNEANFSLGGRLGSRVGFFMSGSWVQQADHNPTARALPRLREEVLQDLYENPQGLLLVNESDPEDRRLVMIPGEMPLGTTVDELANYVDIPAGYRIVSLNPTYRAERLTEEDFVLDPKKTNNQQTEGRLAAHLDVEILPNLTLGLGGYGSTGQQDNWDWGYALFNREPFSQTDSRAGRIYGSLDHAISPSFRYHLLASLDDTRSTTYNPRFSSDVRDVLFYGDIDHPANALVPRYLSVNIPDSIFVLRFNDGIFPGSIYAQFAAPGADGGGYSQSQARQRYAEGHIVFEHGVHTLTLGASTERRTERFFSITNPYGLSRYFNDEDVEAGEERAVAHYEELPYSNLVPSIDRYYGYNYLGTETVDDENIDAFTSRENVDIAPFRSQHDAAYLREQIKWWRISLDLGVRVDRFGHEGRVLKDPYALSPIQRAGDFADTPPGIESDYAVYFSGDNIVGYRDLEGQFYNADGQPVTPNEIVTRGAARLQQGFQAGRLYDAVFAPYKAEVIVQPRLAGNVQVLNKTWFFGYFNKLAQQPWSLMQVTLQEYNNRLQGAVTTGNAALKPERVTSYGVGIRQQIGPVGFIATGFQREYDNLISLVAFRNVFPNNYASFLNHLSGNVKGIDVGVEWMQSDFVFQANYSWQDVTNFPSATSGSIFRVGDLYPSALFYKGSRRHQVKLLAEYQIRQGKGPRLGSIRLLERFRVSLFADVKSGLPYSALLDPYPWNQSVNLTGLRGPINGERMPWSKLLNVQLSRGFRVGGADLTLYVWVQNLLDEDNIRSVWGATGEPDDDGYLDTPGGMADYQGTGRMYYQYRTALPAHYGMPRQVRLGLRLHF